MLKLTFLFALIAGVWQTDSTFKPNDEFKLELEYQFKQRPATDNSKIEVGELSTGENQKRKYGSGPLPYLIVSFTTLKLTNGEFRIKASDSDGRVLISRKITLNEPYKLDLGYTDDMKDRVTPHEFTILFLSEKKKEISRVNMFIKEDGTFLVNGEMRGKF